MAKLGCQGVAALAPLESCWSVWSSPLPSVSLRSKLAPLMFLLCSFPVYSVPSSSLVFVHLMDRTKNHIWSPSCYGVWGWTLQLSSSVVQEEIQEWHWNRCRASWSSLCRSRKHTVGIGLCGSVPAARLQMHFGACLALVSASEWRIFHTDSLSAAIWMRSNPSDSSSPFLLVLLKAVIISNMDSFFLAV